MIKQVVDYHIPLYALLLGEFAERLQAGDLLDVLWVIIVAADILEDHVNGVAVGYAVMRS